MNITKRDGTIVEYDGSKIVQAVAKAMKEVKGGIDKLICYKIEEEVKATLVAGNYPLTVEGIQDSVENVLMSIPYYQDVAKAYILYRDDRNKKREQGWEMTELQSSIYEKKYRHSKESFPDFIKRVSGGNEKIAKLIRDKKFIPAGRILAGRGLNEKGEKVCYSNCFVISPPEDNLESIFDTAAKMARTYSYGGGCGTSLEKLRPNKSLVNNSAKQTSGAVSFAELYSTTTGLIGQNNRRGALMLSMPISHPDIEEFINVKNDLDAVTKANLSVMITDDFMHAVERNEMWKMEFTVEDTGEVITKEMQARRLMRIIAESAHRMAEPGILYWDKVKKYHINSENDGFEYVSVNPCQPLGELILTENGYIPIEDITDHIVLNGKKYTSTPMFKTGTKDVYKVTLEDGSTRRMTDNHVITSIEGDRPLKDLKVGDKVIVDYTPIFDSVVDDINEYHKGILLGFLMADGNIYASKETMNKGYYQWVLGENEFVLEETLTSLLKQYDSNFCFKPHSQKPNTCKIGNIHSLSIRDKIAKDLHLTNSYNKNSADFSLMTKSMKLGVLRGMFTCDGSSRTSGIASLMSIDKKILLKLQTILKEFGVYSNVTIHNNQRSYISADGKRRNNATTYKLQIYDIEFTKIGYLTQCKEKSLLRKAKINNSTVLQNKKKALKISSIEFDGNEDVYDITVDQIHHYNANGLVVHNCGEKPLPSGGSCLLSSLNLAVYVNKNGEFDFKSFDQDVREVVIYMNDLLEEGIQYLPLKEQRTSAERFKQLGIGIMGMADMFIKMKVTYGSIQSIEVIDTIMSIMANAALQQSSLIAKDKGSYNTFDKELILNSEYIQMVANEDTKQMIADYGLRNAELLSIAPTGSISTMLGVSGGTEPIFQNFYTRKTESLGEDGQPQYFKVFTPIVKEYMEQHDIKHENDLPEYFVTAPKIHYKDRIKVQATLQKYIDSAISSTVNVPNDFTIEDVEDLYIEAWKQGLKGITIYRDGCDREGILTTDKPKSKNEEIQNLQNQIDKLILNSLIEDPTTCPMCGGQLIHSGGCSECQDCAYSPCSI